MMKSLSLLMIVLMVGCAGAQVGPVTPPRKRLSCYINSDSHFHCVDSLGADFDTEISCSRETGVCSLRDQTRDPAPAKPSEGKRKQQGDYFIVGGDGGATAQVAPKPKIRSYIDTAPAAPAPKDVQKPKAEYDPKTGEITVQGDWRGSMCVGDSCPNQGKDMCVYLHDKENPVRPCPPGVHAEDVKPAPTWTPQQLGEWINTHCQIDSEADPKTLFVKVWIHCEAK